jgi:hypothetical protein
MQLVVSNLYCQHTVASNFAQSIASLDIPNHRLALTGCLDYYRIPHEQNANDVVVREDGRPLLTAVFDEQNRLTKLDALLEPELATATLPRDR